MMPTITSAWASASSVSGREAQGNRLVSRQTAAIGPRRVESDRVEPVAELSDRGVVLRALEVIVKLIAATTTRTGLRVRSALDENRYPAGLRVSDADMETLHLRPDAFHGEWNYSLLPRLTLPKE